jgi:glutaredoxin
MASNKKNEDDFFEVTLSEDSAKLLTPLAIIVGAALICAAIIYSVEKLGVSSGSVVNTESNVQTEAADSGDVLGSQDASVQNFMVEGTPDVKLFTMSYCPYGNDAEDFVEPVYELLGDNINFEPHYVIYSDYAKNINSSYQQACEQGQTDYCKIEVASTEYCYSDEEKYCSMHGVGELNQNVRELCVWNNQKEKYWDFVMAANSNCTADNIEECWEGVAQDTGVDIGMVRDCENNQAEDLLAQEVKLNEEYEVTGSPTLFVNGTQYNSERVPEAFKNSLCTAFEEQPEECSTKLDDTASEVEGSC